MCESNKLATFQLQLLSKTIDIKKYPFTKIVIDRSLSNEEYDSLFQSLDEINRIYKEQKEEGLLDFTSLLVQFSGTLSEKLNPTETINALKAEGFYPVLMQEFTELLKKEKL